MNELFKIDWVNDWLTPFMWLVATFNIVVCGYSIYRLRKNIREGQWFSAQDYARLAVFESWVRSGARQDQWCEELEFSMRQSAAYVAKHKGPVFYQAFLRYETAADQELDAVIKQLGGTLTHDHQPNVFTIDSRTRS